MNAVEACNIFAEDIELKVDTVAGAEGSEVGVLESVRYDGYAEVSGGGIADGEANPVDCDGSFLDGEVALCFELARYAVCECEDMAAVDFGDAVADGGAVDMSLYDVSVEAAVDFHGALEIDAVAGPEVAEIASAERLVDGSDGVSGVGMKLYDGKAHAVVSYRLVDGELIGKAAFYTEMAVGALIGDCYYCSCFFYYS